MSRENEGAAWCQLAAAGLDTKGRSRFILTGMNELLNPPLNLLSESNEDEMRANRVIQLPRE